MFTAADLIQYLRARRQLRPQSAQRPFGEFPPTWRVWFLTMRVREDAVLGVPAADYVDAFARRTLSTPSPASSVLGRWPATLRLLRQEWGAAPQDQRRQRYVSASLSFLLNVLFAFIFLWRGFAPVGDARPADTPGEAILVEFIGEGTPEDIGGTPAGGEPSDSRQTSGASGQPAMDADAIQVAEQGAETIPAASPQAASASQETASASTAVAEPPPDQTIVSASQPVPVDVAPPDPVPPVTEQPLVVTESQAPDAEFVLPPPTARRARIRRPQLETPPLLTQPAEIEMFDSNPQVRALAPQTTQRELTAPALRDQPTRIEVVESPAPVRSLRADAPQRELTMPALRNQVARIEQTDPQPAVRALEQRPSQRTLAEPTLRSRVAEIEIHEPLPQVRALPNATARRPELRAPTVRAAGDVPLREAAVSTTQAAASRAPAAPGSEARDSRDSGDPNDSPDRGAGAAARPAAQSAAAVRSAGSAPAPGSSGSTRAASAPSGAANPTSGPRPGAAPSTTRGDDWGASDRNVAGSGPAGRTPGLFNSDGSVRLPGDGGRVGGGLPPGTLIEDFEKIDRMGTWLKRPPFDYTPTRLDQFWVPGGTLLEEWVRRGIKTVLVPIPGTSKRLQCTVSLLQAGGGCFITDPNMQDQEATARRPPDVPFKPELQEDQQSLKK